MKIRVEIRSRRNSDITKSIGNAIHDGKILLVQVFHINFLTDMSLSEAMALCGKILLDETIDEMYFSEWKDTFCWHPHTLDTIVEVEYLPGITDTLGKTTENAFAIHNISCSVQCSRLYLLCTSNRDSKEDLVATLLSTCTNPLIEKSTVYEREEYLRRPFLPHTSSATQKDTEHTSLYNTFPLQIENADTITQWKQYSTENYWAFRTEEIEHILQYYGEENTQRIRKQHNLPLDPTDVEIEIIAQSWSEHCKHKIFTATIEYTEDILSSPHHPTLGTHTIHSLFHSHIVQTTKEIEQARNIPWLTSVFTDNAGIVDFDANLYIAIKVETHNSPSALHPYGGALTGILGVQRDILGAGGGATPIANMDVLCFASPDCISKENAPYLPLGIAHPTQVVHGVHHGVATGGNHTGVPTVAGALVFDADYAGKPLVFVGSIGILPKHQQIPTHKRISPGQRICMVGGAIGRDGIHGATFSSMELQEHAPITAVQVGDAWTQKRMMDYIIEARDLGLISAITDNGAGGLSSSVGEMALLSGGAVMDIAKAPTKYPNILPWELVVSESQERMTIAVEPENIEKVFDLAKKHSVSITDVGHFHDSGYLQVFFQDTMIAMLDLHFLHHSLPPMALRAHWNGPRQNKAWKPPSPKRPLLSSILETMQILLHSVHLCSRENWVREYDHEVQGATLTKAFGGSSQQSPNDGAVLWLYPHGGEKEKCIAVAVGLHPRLSLYDPYHMAQYAVDEAIRNLVALGCDMENICMVDNFCWPDPLPHPDDRDHTDAQQKLGELVRACTGLRNIALEYGIPMVSGKDSMKNDFRGKNGKGEQTHITVLPTLLITAMGTLSIHHRMFSAFQHAGDIVYRLGEQNLTWIGSICREIFDIPYNDDEFSPISTKKNKELYTKIHLASQENLLQSLHDISEGGALIAIFECCLGENLGVHLDIPMEHHTPAQIATWCFGEGNGQFIASVSPKNQKQFERLFAGHYEQIGMVQETPVIEIPRTNETLSIVELAQIYRNIDTLSTAYNTRQRP